MSVGRPAPKLTAREAEILALMNDGLTQKAVAVRLGISLRTVEDRLRAARERFNAASCMHLLHIIGSPAIPADRIQRRAPRGRPTIARGILVAVLFRDGMVCQICRAATTTKTFQLDHVIPVIRGGTDTVNNLRVVCRPCNLRKGQGERRASTRGNSGLPSGQPVVEHQ